jgi:4-amino-4-deoxy-L-arabinose transferase-like glycosyltransferase
VKRVPYGLCLAALLAAGALARVAILFWVPTQPVSDFYGFFKVAQSLATEGRYEAGPGGPDGRRSPAYPVLLSLAMRAAGGGDALVASKVANVVLAVLAAWIGARLSRRLWGNSAALWTAAILSFLPRSLLMTNLLAAENLMAPLLLLFLLLCASSWIRGFSPRRAAAIGLACGLMTLTRAVAYAFPLAWLAGAVAARRRWRSLALELAVILLVTHATLLPWAIRNASALGRFTPFNTVGGVGIYLGNSDDATGQWRHWAAELERLHPGVFARGFVAIDDAAWEEALRWIQAHPGRAAGLYLKKLRIIASDDAFAAAFAIFAEGIPAPVELKPVLPDAHPLKAHPNAVSGVLRISGLLLAVCALGGFVLLCRSARKGSSIDRALAVGFLAAALCIPMVSAAMAVNGRYRWAAEDAIAPVAGLFLAYLGARERVRRACEVEPRRELKEPPPPSGALSVLLDVTGVRARVDDPSPAVRRGRRDGCRRRRQQGLRPMARGARVDCDTGQKSQDHPPPLRTLDLSRAHVRLLPAGLAASVGT